MLRIDFEERRSKGPHTAAGRPRIRDHAQVGDQVLAGSRLFGDRPDWPYGQPQEDRGGLDVGGQYLVVLVLNYIIDLSCTCSNNQISVNIILLYSVRSASPFLIFLPCVGWLNFCRGIGNLYVPVSNFKFLDNN